MRIFWVILCLTVVSLARAEDIHDWALLNPEAITHEMAVLPEIAETSEEVQESRAAPSKTRVELPFYVVSGGRIAELIASQGVFRVPAQPAKFSPLWIRQQRGEDIFFDLIIQEKRRQSHKEGW